MSVFTTCDPACDGLHSVDEAHNTRATSRVISDAVGAVTVLKAAQAGGLPLPDQVQVMDLHSTSTLTFYVRTLEDLTHWSTWLDEPIDDQQIGERVHHSVDGEMFDQALRVLAITKAAS